MVKDFLGQELEVGDYLVYGTTMSSGRGLYIGRIVKFNPKTIKVAVVVDTNGIYIDSDERYYNGLHNLYSCECLKIAEEALVVYKLTR